ncbi:MAG: RIO1 family regulatory kinase/ATPase [Myxococcota bacterium]
MEGWTYRPQRPEGGWLEESLGEWFEDGTLVDVLYKVSGGKEAEVYCCLAGDTLDGRLLAAKVYRPRWLRELSNDAAYREGRGLVDAQGNRVRARDQRTARALRKGSRFGKASAHTSWVMHEHRALQQLHLAGGAVPEPFDANPNAVLTAFVGDETGGAPALSRVHLEPEQVPGVVGAVLDTVEKLLALGWAHGDLSPYNVLWWEDHPVVIDLPQVVDVLRNARGPELFLRDVERICALDRGGVLGLPRDLADDLWDKVFGTVDGVPDGCVAH